jgi:hypothetical protein
MNTQVENLLISAQTGNLVGLPVQVQVALHIQVMNPLIGTL